jgi:hypothetical protein
LSTIDLLDSVDVNPNGGAFEARFWGGANYVSRVRSRSLAAMPGEGRAPQTFPKWPSDHSSHQQEVGGLRTAKKNRVQRAVAKRKASEQTEA